MASRTTTLLAAMLALGVATCHEQPQAQHRFSAPNATAATPALVVDESSAATGGRFEYVQVTSAAPRPASKGPESAKGRGDVTAGMDAETRAGLQFLSNIYNPHHWTIPSDPAAAGPLGHTSAACRGQLRSYLSSLDNGTTWAVQSKRFKLAETLFPVGPALCAFQSRNARSRILFQVAEAAMPGQHYARGVREMSDV